MAKSKAAIEPDRGAASGTVARVVQVLRFIAERKRSIIRDAAIELKLAPSTVHRLFDLLAREGLIEQDKIDRSYGAGPEFFRIGAQVVGRYDLRSIALPILREVVAACEETCILGLYLRTVYKVTFAERVDSPTLLRYQLPLNTQMPLLSGATGRSVLAFLPEDEIKQVLDNEAGEKTERAKVLAELKIIHKQGYAISHGEMIAGAMAIAAPVIGAEGVAIGSIAVTAPNKRMHRAGARRVINLVCSKASELSLRMGGSAAKAPPAGRTGPAQRQPASIA